MAAYDKYESIIGLEVHAQLLTKSKIFSSDSTEFGAAPNTNISIVSLGYPGTLPVLNKKTIEYAVRMGIACNCTIKKENIFSRKNYFYADLPKGYQITQHTTPICVGGFINIKKSNHEGKTIRLTRIHLEEDAGKSMHDQDIYDSLIDLNRAGIPLIEIVSEPDIRTPEEAYQYLTEIRKIVRYLDVCDGNMEEGSLRCDANVSVRIKNTEPFGTKVEIKNMNSITNVRRALEYEIKRQIEEIETGNKIPQETRSYDALNGTTFRLRSKEMAHDYRYFPEPDLPPLTLTDEYINTIKQSMPQLPEELFKKYITDYKLSDYDCTVLTETKEIAFFFEEILKNTKNYKAAANWILGPVKSYLNENAISIKEFPVKPTQIAELIKLIEDNMISNTAASQKVFPELSKQNNKTPIEIAQQLNLIQESNIGSLQLFIDKALEKYPEKIIEYKAGKKGLLGLFMGEVMKLSQGKADPKVASELLKKCLE